MVFFVIKYCITESSFEMLYRVVCILIFCIGPVVTFEITSNCWIGQLEVRIDLLCPEYTGNGKTFCCGDPASRFCCTREEFQKDTREEHQENTRHREIKTSSDSDMIEENGIIVKSDTETKSFKYGEMKIQSGDFSFDLESFRIKVLC